MAHFLHPVKVAVLEALLWVDRPLSPREMDRIFGEEFGVSLVSYHVRGLAAAGIVEVVKRRPVRGAMETFYRLCGRSEQGADGR